MSSNANSKARRKSKIKFHLELSTAIVFDNELLGMKTVERDHVYLDVLPFDAIGSSCQQSRSKRIGQSMKVDNPIATLFLFI